MLVSMPYPKPMMVMMGGLIAILFADVVLFAVGLVAVADVLGTVGSLVWMLGFLAYVVFVDSRHRWPGVRAFHRYARVITFYRDE